MFLEFLLFNWIFGKLLRVCIGPTKQNVLDVAYARRVAQ